MKIKIRFIKMRAVIALTVIVLSIVMHDYADEEWGTGSFNSVKTLNDIPNGGSGVHLTGKMFDVQCVGDKVIVRVIDESATIEDFVLFLLAKGWNARLSQKFNSGVSLSKDELNLSKLILQADLLMIDAITLSLYVDWKLLECKQFNETISKHVGWEVPLSNTDFSRSYPNERVICMQLMDRFLNQNSGFRQTIFSLAWCFNKLPENAARAIFSFVVSPEKQGYTAGGTSNGIMDRVLQYALAPNPFTTPRARDLTEIEKEALKVSVASKEFSTKWIYTEKAIVRYLRLAWQTYKAFEKYGENQGLRDTDIKALAEFNLAANQNLEKCHEDLVQVVYDYPFAVLTLRTFGQYRKSKGFFYDDEDKMEVAMRQYGEAVSGTKMVKRLSSDVVIDLYERLLQDFKADLDATPFSGNFQRVCIGARLKELSIRTRKRDVETGIKEFDLSNQETR